MSPRFQVSNSIGDNTHRVLVLGESDAAAKDDAGDPKQFKQNVEAKPDEGATQKKVDVMKRGRPNDDERNYEKNAERHGPVSSQLFSAKSQQYACRDHSEQRDGENESLLDHATLIVPAVVDGQRFRPLCHRGLQIQLFVDSQEKHPGCEREPECFSAAFSSASQNAQECCKEIAGDGEPTGECWVADPGLPIAVDDDGREACRE